MQAGGLAPKRAKIDPNAFSGAAGAAGAGSFGEDATAVEKQAAVRPRSLTYLHGRKRQASVMPEPLTTEEVPKGATAVDAAASSGRSEDDAASPTLLAAKSCKGIRDAVIQRNGLLSGAGPRSDASPTDSSSSGAAAIKRAQKARDDLFKRLFPNSHARLTEEQATSGRATSGQAANRAAAAASPGRTDDLGVDESGKAGIGGRLIATRL